MYSSKLDGFEVFEIQTRKVELNEANIFPEESDSSTTLNKSMPIIL